jgi:hypothetical protein
VVVQVLKVPVDPTLRHKLALHIRTWQYACAKQAVHDVVQDCLIHSSISPLYEVDHRPGQSDRLAIRQRGILFEGRGQLRKRSYLISFFWGMASRWRSAIF